MVAVNFLSMHRRAILSATGVLAFSGFTGCLFGHGDEPGLIEIHNEDNRDHTVAVTVEKTSQDDDDVRGRTTHGILTPTATPIWRRERTFEVPKKSDFRETDFLAEPGAFFIRTELDSGATSATWLGLYESQGGVAEEKLVIHISEDGEITAFAATAE